MDVFVAGFIGSPPMNLIEDGASWLGFRPENFLPVGIEATDEHLVLPFRISRIEYLGADRLVYGVLEDGHKGAAVISKIPSNIRVEIAAGERYDFALRRRDIERFDRHSGRRAGGAAR
jgi:multiple sugar transport system ATP-binding protein